MHLNSCFSLCLAPTINVKKCVFSFLIVFINLLSISYSEVIKKDSDNDGLLDADEAPEQITDGEVEFAQPLNAQDCNRATGIGAQGLVGTAEMRLDDLAFLPFGLPARK